MPEDDLEKRLRTLEIEVVEFRVGSFQTGKDISEIKNSIKEMQTDAKERSGRRQSTYIGPLLVAAIAFGGELWLHYLK